MSELLWSSGARQKEAGRGTGGPAGAPGALTGVGGGGPAGFPPTVGGPDIVVVVVEGAAPVDLGTEAELSSLDEQGGLWCLLLVLSTWPWHSPPQAS